MPSSPLRAAFLEARSGVSVIKRRHGLDRSRYKGEAGMKRWVWRRGLFTMSDKTMQRSGAGGDTLQKASSIHKNLFAMMCCL
jgi:hypothetical protein